MWTAGTFVSRKHEKSSCYWHTNSQFRKHLCDWLNGYCYHAFLRIQELHICSVDFQVDGWVCNVGTLRVQLNVALQKQNSNHEYRVYCSSGHPSKRVCLNKTVGSPSSVLRSRKWRKYWRCFHGGVFSTERSAQTQTCLLLCIYFIAAWLCHFSASQCAL